MSWAFVVQSASEQTRIDFIATWHSWIELPEIWIKAKYWHTVTEWNGKQTMRTNRNIFFAGYGIDFKPLQMFTNQPQQRQILKIRDLTVFDVIIVGDSSNKQLYLLNIWPRCESQSVILTSISFCIHLSLGLVSFSLERKRFSDTDLHSLKKNSIPSRITYANSFICDSCC